MMNEKSCDDNDVIHRHGNHDISERLFNAQVCLVENKKSVEQNAKDGVEIKKSAKSIAIKWNVVSNPPSNMLLCKIKQKIVEDEQQKVFDEMLKKINEKVNEEEEDEENKNSLSTVVKMGLVGTFELIKSTADNHEDLCCKTLKALLQVLQGQGLGNLKDESDNTLLESLFDVLLNLSTRTDMNYTQQISDQFSTFESSLPKCGPISSTNDLSFVDNNVASLACSCLISLVLAWGNAAKILSISTTFIADCSSQKNPLFFKVPQTLVSFQRTLMGLLTKQTRLPTIMKTGIPSTNHSFQLRDHTGGFDMISLECDGCFLYFLTSDGILLKYGSGYNSTLRGVLYMKNINPMETVTCKQKVSLSTTGCLLHYKHDELYITTKTNRCYLVNRNNLTLKYICSLSGNIQSSKWMLSESGFCKMKNNTKNSFSFEFYEINGMDKCVKKDEIIELIPTETHLLAIGKVDLPIHTFQDSSLNDTIISMIWMENFALSLDIYGRVYFSGKSEKLGVIRIDKKKYSSEAQYLSIPGTPHIISIHGSDGGDHAILISDQGDAYFVGSSKRGEDGVTNLSKMKIQQQTQNGRVKLMTCMKGKKINSACCNIGTSALVTNDGKLYLFGKDSSQADKHGLVTSLKGEHVVQVSMGKAHIVVLTNDGNVWTAGVNYKGQCGRPIFSSSTTDHPTTTTTNTHEEASTSGIAPSSVAPSNMAPSGGVNVCGMKDHRFNEGGTVCKICTICNSCTGFGDSCVNHQRSIGKQPGVVCGCGEGWAGCEICGCCRVCANEIGVHDGMAPIVGGEEEDMLEDDFGELIQPHERPLIADEYDGNAAAAPEIPNQQEDKEFWNVMGFPDDFDGFLDELDDLRDVIPRNNRVDQNMDNLRQRIADRVARDRNGQIGGKLVKKIMDKKQKSGNKKKQTTANSTTNADVNHMNLLPFQKIHFNNKTSTNLSAVKISCGAHHTLVLMSNGQVYGFGRNSQSQLGVGNSSAKFISTPTRVELNDVKDISAGSYHSLFLLKSGLCYGCGSNKHGQLGDRGGADDDEIVKSPTIVMTNQQKCVENGEIPPKISSIHATQQISMFIYEEVLFDGKGLRNLKLFGCKDLIGILYQPLTTQDNNNKKCTELLLLDKKTQDFRRFRGKEKDFFDENTNLFCYDNSHELFYGYNAQTQTMKYLLPQIADVKSTTISPFSPEVAIPMISGQLMTRTLAGLNLLACLNTIAHTTPLQQQTDKEQQQQVDPIMQQKRCKNQQQVEVGNVGMNYDFSVVQRFKSYGGGWGYSPHSIEAIRFSCDKEILLGGVGMYGGRGEYSANVILYKDGSEQLVADELYEERTILTQVNHESYECAAREKHRVLFTKPVLIEANSWYTIQAKMSGPSSDCGSRGTETITTGDGIKFTFRRSKISNNGTDVTAGQIPELLYTLPSTFTTSNKINKSKEEKLSTLEEYIEIQSLDANFFQHFSKEAIDTLPYLMSWTRTSFFTDFYRESTAALTSQMMTSSNNNNHQLVSNSIKNLSFVFAASLHLTRFAILHKSGERLRKNPQIYVESIGIMEQILTDGELDDAIEDSKSMSEKDKILISNFALQVMSECHETMMKCVDIFYPKPQSKWFYLQRNMSRYLLTDMCTKKRNYTSRLLVLALDALRQPHIDRIECLPLFPRSLSNLSCTTSTDDQQIHDEAAFGNMSSNYKDVVSNIVKIATSFNEENTSGMSYHQILVNHPMTSLVVSSCEFISTLSCDFAYRGGKQEKTKNVKNYKIDPNQLHHLRRFEVAKPGILWDCGGSDSPDEVSFTVYNDDVILYGIGLYGGGKEDHQYSIKIEANPNIGRVKKFETQTMESTILNTTNGKFSSIDCNGENIAICQLSEVVFLTREQIYTISVNIHGGKTYCGERGKITVKGPDGTEFKFMSSYTGSGGNGTCWRRGQIPVLVYTKCSEEDKKNLFPEKLGGKTTEVKSYDDWHGVAMTSHDASQTYQHHVINMTSQLCTIASNHFKSILQPHNCFESSNEMTSSFGENDVSNEMMKLERILSSQLITRLLPKLFANIVILVCNFAVPAYEVVGLVQNLLPLLTTAQRKMNENNNNNNKQEEEENNKKQKSYTLVVESQHPYQSGKVQQYRARFADSVSYMTVEFDHRCQTAQKEDYLQIYAKKSNSKQYDRVQILNKMNLSENWPMESVVIPGNELEFVMTSSSDYQKNLDKKPTSFYGFRCLVTGYDNGRCDVIDPVTSLINEMISCCGEAVKKLMSMEEDFLPCEGIQADDENDKSSPRWRSLEDKFLQFSVNVSTTMNNYDNLLSHSFHLESFPTTITSILTDSLPLNKSCPEKKFLFDFIQADPNTNGGKLARWLQPESYVDPPSCLLQVHSASLIESLPTSITILTRDQNGTPVHVPSLGVELQARSQRTMNGTTPSELPSPSNIPLPTCEYRPVTKYAGYRYHSISMMSEYQDFSFEEIRLAIPQAEKITVNRAKDGMYRAKWTPTCSGSYKLQVLLDGQLKGPSVIVDVQPPLDGKTEQISTSSSTSSTNQHKLLKFVQKNSKGIRLRSKPSLLSPQIALLNSDDVIEYDEEISNGDGKWVKMSKDAMVKYCPGSNEGFCLRFNQLSQKTLLLPATSVQQQNRQVEIMKSSVGSLEESSADEIAANVVSTSSSNSDIMTSQQLMTSQQIMTSQPPDERMFTAMLEQMKSSQLTSQLNGDANVIRLSQSDPGILGQSAPSQQDETKMEASSAVCKFQPPEFQPPQFPAPQITDFKPSEFKSPEIPLSLRTRSRTLKKKVSTTENKKSGNSVKKRSSQSLGSSLPSAIRRKTNSSTTTTTSSTTKRPFNQQTRSFSSKRSSTASPTAKRSASTTTATTKKNENEIDDDLPRNKVIRGRRSCDVIADNIPFIDAVDSEGNNITKQSTVTSSAMMSSTSSTKQERSIPHKLALAPSTAESIRSVFAALLWHERLVEDAIVTSKYLQSNENVTKQDAIQSEQHEQNGEGGPGTSGISAGVSDVVIPPSICYLATLWQSISAQVTKAANQSTMGNDDVIGKPPQHPLQSPAIFPQLTKKRKDKKPTIIKQQRKQFYPEAAPPMIEPRLLLNPPPINDILNGGGDNEDAVLGGLFNYGGGRAQRNRGDDNRRYGMLQARQMIHQAAELFNGVPRFDLVGGGRYYQAAGRNQHRNNPPQAAINMPFGNPPQGGANLPFALRQPPLPPAAAEPLLRRPRRQPQGGGNDVIGDYYRMWNNFVLPPQPLPAVGHDGKLKKNSRSICEMCAEEHDYPITKHMEKCHPGCKQYTDGMSFNQRGFYGSSGRSRQVCGTITGRVYIMCKKCKEKNTKLSSKKPTPSSSKTSKKNIKTSNVKNNEEKDLTSVYKMFRDNAMFLLELDRNPASKYFSTNLANSPTIQNYLTDRVNNEENGFYGKIEKSSDDNSCESGTHQQDLLPSSSTGPCFFPSISCNFINKIQREMEELPPHEFRISTPEPAAEVKSFSNNNGEEDQKMRNDDSTDDVGEMEQNDVINDVMTSSNPPLPPPTSLDLNLNIENFSHVTVNSPSQQLVSMMKKSQNNCYKNKNTTTTTNNSDACSIVDFISVKHELKSLRIILSVIQRKAIMRVYGLQALTWLLRSVNDEDQLHAIMWYFVSSTKDQSCDVTQIRHKNEHPVNGVLNCGNIIILPLIEAFHGFLQSVADVITHLPHNSSPQLMAIRCWNFEFLPIDHNFFHFSQIFSHINKMLSSHDDVIKSIDEVNRVEKLMDITSLVEVLPSSHKAIAASLTDGSTETFWESGEQDKNRMKSLVITSPLADMEEIWVHIDNTRDPQKKVTKLSFFACDECECWKQAGNQNIISPQFVGWIECRFVTSYKKIRIELRGPDNCLRIRQIRVFGSIVKGDKIEIQHSNYEMNNEMKIIEIFKLLTTQIFGDLLSSENDDVTPNNDNDDDELKVMTSSQSSQSSSSIMTSLMKEEKHLTTLQLKICDHIISAIGGETSRIGLAFRCNPKLLTDSPEIISDKYCNELLSMILKLSGNQLGCDYISQQNSFIKNLMSLLHTATPRIQKQVTTLWKRILANISPQKLSEILQLKLPDPQLVLNYLKKNDEISGNTPNCNDDDVPSIFDPFLAFIAKSISVQLKNGLGKSPTSTAAPVIGDKSKRIQIIDIQTSLDERYINDKQLWWMQGGKPEQFVVESVVKLIYDVIHNEMGKEWSDAAKSCISRALLQLTRLEENDRKTHICVSGHQLWLALASLCVLDEDHVDKLSSSKRITENKTTCDNHDDGETLAIIDCDNCGKLCAECDRFLHLNRKTRQHQRQVFKEEEESIRVDLHEGCGRLKLFWFLALADSRTLKAVVEFKTTNINTTTTNSDGRGASTSSGGCCRFCGRKNESLALTSICNDVTCQQLAAVACTKTLICGHHCGGVVNEENCLDCLFCCDSLKQDCDDMCMICFTDSLSTAPSIKLSCGHIFHFLCYEILLKKRWSGPRITFGFMNCSICKMEVSHVSLEKYLSPLRELKKEVEGKALQRLEYEGLINCESITSTRSKFHKNPLLYALDKYAYYVCHKCNKAYYGGDVRCDVEANLNEENFDSSELICGACSNISCAQICDKHGTDFLEYKCRYCCSVAVYFCFGTTHFCRVCHDDFQRIVNVSKEKLPKCPAGPGAQQLDCPQCPLNLQHPPTGQEFALGCGVCRNANTF